LSKKRFTYLRELAKLTNSDPIALSKVKDPDLSKYDIVFNWGVICNNGINNPDAIRLTSNKISLRKSWLENNLSITPFLSSLQMEADTLYVIRPSYHEGGKNFHLGTREDINNAIYQKLIKRPYYISPYIDKDREFRVHVMGGAVLFIQEKYREDGKKIIGNWNHTNGHVFRILGWSEIRPKLAKLAVEAMKVSGLFFGAIDIMQVTSKNKMSHDPNQEQKGDEYFLLEINTAPRLERRSIELYANAINYYKVNGGISRSRVKQLFTNREGESDDNA